MCRCDRLTKEDVKKFFKENGTLEDWLRLSPGQRRDILINGRYTLDEVVDVLGIGRDALVFRIGKETVYKVSYFNPIDDTNAWHYMLVIVYEVGYREMLIGY